MAASWHARAVTGCVFCGIAGGDPASLVFEDATTVAFLDIRPVFPGHTLVAPRTHIETLDDLPDGQLAPFFAVVKRVAGAVERALGAGGTFVAINNKVSQSVPHLHCHVVPRTKGDGLRGFFWPRHRYASDEEAADYAARIRTALGEDG
jgi:histidine triad (HIT) family protein